MRGSRSKVAAVTRKKMEDEVQKFKLGLNAPGTMFHWAEQTRQGIKKEHPTDKRHDARYKSGNALPTLMEESLGLALRLARNGLAAPFEALMSANDIMGAVAGSYRAPLDAYRAAKAANLSEEEALDLAEEYLAKGRSTVDHGELAAKIGLAGTKRLFKRLK